MSHMHITTWVIAIVLLFVASSLIKKGNISSYKMTHMILRVVYLLIIATGTMMILSIENWSGQLIGEYGSKVLLGIILIGLVEMILVKMSKGKNVKGLIISSVVVFALTIALGLKLPIGF